jgi:hypothetical protein
MLQSSVQLCMPPVCNTVLIESAGENFRTKKFLADKQFKIWGTKYLINTKQKHKRRAFAGIWPARSSDLNPRGFLF